MFKVIRLLALIPAMLVAGCITQNTASKAPHAELSALKTFYVQHIPADGRRVDNVIAAQLQLLGYQATTGDSPAPPSPVDAVVTYQDRWQWDMSMFMLSLDIQFRDPATKDVIASGHTLRSSLARTSPDVMAKEVLTAIFAAR